MEPDFGGYATKNDLRCTDNRVIRSGAFSHQNGQKVPLVWQHKKDSPSNVLGHAILENRPDGVYAHGYFNDSESAQEALRLVQHKDIDQLSIHATQLKQSGYDVTHGRIHEVSLVMAGANPGAFIDHVNIVHSDGGYEVMQDEAVIYTEEILELTHSANPQESQLSHEESSDKEETVQDVYNSMSQKQKDVLYYMIGEALNSGDGEAEQDDHDDNYLTHDLEGNQMTHNVFESQGAAPQSQSLTHDQISAIVADAERIGSFKESFLMHAEDYGIQNIDILFPDPKALRNAPDFVSRRMEWVPKVWNATNKSPFSRIKSMSADITHEEARAKGYIKGNLKKEEFFALSKRVTTPTTVYKKQKLDRDDIIDITDLDVVAWLKAEMRVMLDEELARAILVGDGREPDDEDKIKDPAGASEGAGIRSIANDADFYAHQVTLDEDSTADAKIEAVIRSRKDYKGSGNPTLYTTEDVITDMLLLKDTIGRRLYRTEAELASELRVKELVPVEVMEGHTDLFGIMVNLSDYTVGADRGGAISMFDDFDIDYNQYKYLIETRCSGALTRPKSAVVFKYGEVAPDPDPEG